MGEILRLCGYYIPGIGEVPAALIGRGSEESVLAALRSGKESGAVLAAAVPSEESEFDWYRQLGFAQFFMIERTPVKLKLLGDAEEEISDLPAEQAGRCGDVMFQVARWRGHLTRTEEMWRDAASSELAVGGGVLACRRQGEVAGYAFYRPTEAGVVIDELFCQDEPAFIALQREVMVRCGVEEATLCAPACPHGAVRHGMIRALDCSALIRAGIQRRPGDFAIEIADPLTDCDGCWSAKDGSVERSARRGVGITTGEFAAIILGGGPAPYVNLVF